MKTKSILIVILILAVVLVASGCIETTSNGKHNGQITAIEKNGLIWKTYTVYVKSDISSSQEDKYCLEDQSLIQKLEKFSADRTKVTITYRDELIKAPWRCGEERGGIITNAEVK